MTAIVYLTNGWLGALLVVAVLAVVIAVQGRQQRAAIESARERDRAARVEGARLR